MRIYTNPKIDLYANALTYHTAPGAWAFKN
jgi:hypothetical protein